MNRTLSTIVSVTFILVICGCVDKEPPNGPGVGGGNRTGVWEFQNPRTTAYDLNDLEILPSGVGWAVGDGGTVLKTEDEGLTWKQLQFPMRTKLNAVASWDEDHAVVVGSTLSLDEYSSEGIIWYTSNGGISWNRSLTPNLFGLADVAVIKENVACAIGDSGQCLLTTDAGQTWFSSIESVFGKFLCIKFIDNQNGWILSDRNSIYNSRDGGNTWSFLGHLIENQFVHPTVGKLDFTDRLHGFVALSSGELYRTMDGGTSWSFVKKVTGSPIQGIRFLDPQNGFVLATNFYVTFDSGQTWFAYSRPSPFGGLNCLESCGSGDLLRFLSVGTYGTVYRSQDALGDQWIETNGETRADLHAVHFFNSRVGVAAGYGYFTDDYLNTGGPRLLRTEDGGASWEPVNLEPSVWASSFSFIDSRRGWAAAGGLLSTIDAGASWKFMYTAGPAAPIEEIDFVDTRHGWLRAQDALYYTNDGGFSSQILPPGDHTLDFDLADSANGWIISTSGDVLYLPSYNSDGFLYLDFGGSYARTIFSLDASHLWIGGKGNRIWSTNNKGVDWTLIHEADNSTGTYPLIYELAFCDTLNGWKIYSLDGASKSIARTTDGGRTWTDEELPLSSKQQFNSLYTLDPENVWAVGPYGLIAHGDYSRNWK